ncbi:hypothetical protein TYRP_009667 [Tyrophagus putrescentiae]|nr:hypothetical protein TYRP_009667 [Tyrophagus putrescentiae]
MSLLTGGGGGGGGSWPLMAAAAVALAVFSGVASVRFLPSSFPFRQAFGAQFFTSLPLSLLVPSFISGNGGSGSRIIIIITIVLIAHILRKHGRGLKN